MYAQPGKKLLFMGGEIGQWGEWNRKSLDWHLLEYEPHRKFQAFVKDLNALYAREPRCTRSISATRALNGSTFSDYERSIVSFIRKARTGDFLVFVFNFTPVRRYNYRIGVPKWGFYREVLNSDSSLYWGSDTGNQGGRHTDPVPWHGRPCSINLDLPPLGALVFKLV